MLKDFCFIFLLSTWVCFSQEISSFQQYNGRFDYTAIGNTLNPAENNLDGSFCQILASSSADFNLDPSNEIIAAYLFWAGSGLGDTRVSLNDTEFSADNTYNVFFDETPTVSLPYFSCVKDITAYIISEGNTTYTLSDLDISDTLSTNPRYCNNRTNFAGWSIYVIYKNDLFPLNQINLFVGLDIINRFVSEKTILIDNLNVLDNDNAKIGFLAWEGDNALNFGESLSINDNILSNPPLNNSDNAFNGTNTFTNSNTLFNVDLDVYDIESNIRVGDTEATIKLTTGGFDIFGNYRADLIILNNIITVLNSQVPDATVVLDNHFQECINSIITLDYTISNNNSTEILPTNTPIAIYADNILVAQTFTTQAINIDESLSLQTTLTLPTSIIGNYTLTIVVDDDGFGNSTVQEISETNNTSITPQTALPLTEFLPFSIVNNCNENNNVQQFNLESIITTDLLNEYLSFSYFENISDLNTNSNEIIEPDSYEITDLPATIYVNAEKLVCFDVLEIILTAENCDPIIPQGISPNNDGLNDILNIKFKSNIIPEFKFTIFNRYGTKVFKGNRELSWNGTSNIGINKGELLPTGTYYYVLNILNRKNTITGWIYLNK